MTTHDRESANIGHLRGESPPPLIEVMPQTLLDEPLAYIFADHFRQRRICTALRRFALASRVVREEADPVASFLSNDVPLNHADEEEDLFPVVHRRALVQDGLGNTLARLVDDHRRSKSVICRIVTALSCGSTDAVEFDEQSRAAMLLYASSEGSHLADENGVVLAVARMRLIGSDLAAMTRGMKARRGMAL